MSKNKHTHTHGRNKKMKTAEAKQIKLKTLWNALKRIIITTKAHCIANDVLYKNDYRIIKT